MLLALSTFPLVLLSILAFVIMLSLIVSIHELGHLIFAKRAGILCHEYSIGFGPAIYKHKFKETTFAIRCIPLGGYVSMAGEEIAESLVNKGDIVGLNFNGNKVSEIVFDENKKCDLKGKVINSDLYASDLGMLYISIECENGSIRTFEVLKDAFYVFKKDDKMQVTPYDRCFESKSWIDRFLTIFAGPFMNIVLAIVLLIIAALASGYPNSDSNVIGSFTNGAESSYVLNKKDKILGIEDSLIDNWYDVSNAYELYLKTENYIASSNDTVKVKYERNGVVDTTDITPYIIIQNIGLTNLYTYNLDNHGYNGAIVGGSDINGTIKANPRYKDSKGSLSYGDIITKVKINDNEAVDVTSWKTLIEEIGSLTTASDIRFEYYDIESEKIITLDECKVLENYTDEVLDNQGITKIAIKLGLTPSKHFSFLAIGNGFKQFWSDFTLIFRTIKLLIAPSDVRQIGISDMSSFVGIYSIVKRYVTSGFISLISLTALLSVNIGVMNILPIPALDGGRIVFLLYEGVTRKKPSRKIENIINNIFLGLLLLLFFVITYFDITRLIKG